MPIVELESQDTLFLSYSFRKSKPKISYRIEANSRVHVYVVNDEGLRNYKGGRGFYIFNINRFASIHNEEIILESSGQWHLIINNSNNRRVSVFYEIFEQ